MVSETPSKISKDVYVGPAPSPINLSLATDDVNGYDELISVPYAQFLYSEFVSSPTAPDTFLNPKGIEPSPFLKNG